MKKVTSLLAGCFALAAVTATAQTTVYETGFETTGDPSGANFTAASLQGQGAVSGRFGGWTVEGVANVVSTPLTPQSGSTYVNQAANSTITAEVSSTAPRMLVRAYHYGAGATVPAAPDPLLTAAAVIAFKSTGASTYVVNAFNGTTSAFVEPGSPVALSTSAWNKVVLSLNYAAKTYDVQVANAPYLSGLGFFTNSITQFNGFRSSTTVGSNIDTVGFFASNGDFDGDGRTDDLEMTTLLGDPLDSSAFPNLGDVNVDGDVNLVDPLLLFRALAIPGFPTGGLELNQDINRSGTTTTEDARDLYGFVVGELPVIPTN